METVPAAVPVPAAVTAVGVVVAVAAAVTAVGAAVAVAAVGDGSVRGS